MYSIYKITSPSGKFYIGLTKNPVKERWRQHIKRAKADPRNHPFYRAILKYGPGAFSVEVIDTAASKQEAQKKERYWIAEAPKESLYNLSPGGEADGEVGGKKFWEEIRKDPERMAAYLKSLSEAKKANDWSDYRSLSQKAGQWRRDNPKEAYRHSRRASRVAARLHGASEKKEPELSLKERLRKKFKDSEVRSERTATQWATRTDEQRREIFDKIASSARENWAAITDQVERSGKTAAARAAIDRNRQAAAASSGLKKFWEDLRADPEKYKEYMERRTASLHDTLQRKSKDIRHSERRTK